jgi:hypothetical protein
MNIIRTLALGGVAFYAGAYTVAKLVKSNTSHGTRQLLVAEMQESLDRKSAEAHAKLESSKRNHPAGKSLPNNVTPIRKGK